jgi:hypothetical protein
MFGALPELPQACNAAARTKTLQEGALMLTPSLPRLPGARLALA